jgi:hypothetical protein
MSGEAYNGAHLIQVDSMVGGYGPSLADLERLEADLRATPEAVDLANAVGGVVALIRDLRRRCEDVQAVADPLFSCLHDFAWWKSADSSEDRFRETLAAWKADR